MAETKLVGVDVGGTFTDLVLVDEATGDVRVAKVPTTLREPGHRRAGARCAGDGRGGGRAQGDRARDDHRDQCAARAQGRADGAHHDARLPRRARAGAPHAPHAVRAQGQLRAADPARAAPRGRRARRRRGPGRRAARRGPGARGGAPAPGAGRRGARDPLHPLLPERRARAPGARDRRRRSGRMPTSRSAPSCCPSTASSSGGRPRRSTAFVQPVIDRYLRKLAGDLAAQGYRRELARHAGQWRHHVGRRRRAPRREHAHVGTRRRREGRRLHGAGGRAPEHHLLRHGRDELRRRRHPRRPPRAERRQGDGLRPARAGADDRHPHDRRGRRLDRPRELGRHPAGGTRERGRRSRVDLLRPRRRRSPPSPTPTSCWAGSIRRGCSASAAPRRLDRIREIFDTKIGAHLGLGARTRWPAPSCASPTTRWRAPSGSCRSSAATTRATSSCSPSAAPGPSTPSRSRASWPFPTVLVPARPGITSALGCLVADVRHDFVKTVNQPVLAPGHRRGAPHPGRRR